MNGSTPALAIPLIVGYDKGAWERTITASAFTPAGTQAQADSSAWYVKNDVTLAASGTRISVGWRTEALDKSEASSATALNQRQHAWELGVSQPLGSGVTAYGRVGRSFRLGNVDEFSFTNPSVALQPQTSRDWELGARWKAQATALEARWYRSALRNEIGYDPSGTGPFGPFGANVNFDPTRRQGLELSLTQALSSTLDLHLNAAWRQAQFTSGVYAGNDVMLVPKRTLALRADWRPAADHSVGAGVVWVSSQSPDFANRCTIPSYATVDLRYAYTWRNAEFALGIANLADHKYYTQAFGCTAAGRDHRHLPRGRPYCYGFDVVQVLGTPMDHDALVAAGLVPRRIVRLTERTTKWLCLLGQQHRIVGISGFAERGARHAIVLALGRQHA